LSKIGGVFELGSVEMGVSAAAFARARDCSIGVNSWWPTRGSGGLLIWSTRARARHRQLVTTNKTTFRTHLQAQQRGRPSAHEWVRVLRLPVSETVRVGRDRGRTDWRVGEQSQRVDRRLFFSRPVCAFPRRDGC
jgi:hypothetical protein